jgi:hypothetical protein
MMALLMTLVSLLSIQCATAAPAQEAPQAAVPPVGVLNANITQTAGGSVPNVSAPLKLTAAAQTGFQLLLFLEELEVYFYYEGLQNLTNKWNLTGLPSDTLEVISKTAAVSPSAEAILRLGKGILTTVDIRQQEDVHVATLQAVLRNNNATIIPPCNYTFPVSTPQEFFALGNIITPTNFGSIIGLESQIAASDPATVFSASSILATEVRHEVFLRSTNGEIPNPAPFDTGVPPAWAYNIGLQFVMPGSCPIEVDLQTYPPIYLSPNLGPRFASPTYPTTLSFTWDTAQSWVAREGKKQLFVAWVNLANQPRYTPLKRIGAGAGTTAVPKGLQDVAFVALTSEQPDNLDDLSAATLAGPLGIPFS